MKLTLILTTCLSLIFGCKLDDFKNELITENTDFAFVGSELENSKSYIVGGRTIKIPLLAYNFQFLSEDFNELMNVFVPPTNELICSFVLDEESDFIENGSESPLSMYAIVQFPKHQAKFDVSQSDFLLVVKEMKTMMNNQEMNDLTKSSQDLLNQRFENMDLSELSVEIG